MRSDSVSRRDAVRGLAATALPLGLIGCSSRDPNSLVIGGLPVTCNLTLPVACEANSAIKAPPGVPHFKYDYEKISGWPEVKESLMAGRIQAAYMLAPLVMDLADKGIPM